jgi:HPt (histidine-containing phosphotransfer) domain-containing protein
MDAFVSKPVRPQKLAEVIESVVLRSPATADSRQPDAAAEPPIDWPAALNNVGGNRDLLAQIVALVQAELPRLLAEAVQAVRSRQGPQLRMAACTLKGLFRTLGPRHAMQLADRLEALGATGDLTAAPALFVELELASRQLLALLSQTNVSAEARPT